MCNCLINIVEIVAHYPSREEFGRGQMAPAVQRALGGMASRFQLVHYLQLMISFQEHRVKGGSEATSDLRGYQYCGQFVLSAVGVGGGSGVLCASLCHPWTRSSLWKAPSSDIL